MASTMIRFAARRACSLAVVLALLLAPVMPGAAPERSCGQCPPGCPMHARRLGCHHGAAMRCHRSGSSNAIRTACSHAPDRATPASEGMRGVIPAPARLAAAFTPRSTTQRARVLVTQHEPEPASHPPKLLA